jgi:cytochrome c-type biogenesis protein CcmE
MSTRTVQRIQPKHQRLILIVVALAALLGASLLAIWGLRSQASYFYIPSEIVAARPDPGRGVRLGGMVEKGSLRTEPDGVTIGFVVGDGRARVPVRFRGIVPSLFTEGSGVVAEGKLGKDGTFIADNLLAKHDERYVPREMKDMTAAQAKRVVAETK